MNVVNLAEEIVGGVLQQAELLRGAAVAADAGTVESLRWAGALPLLLRDLSVTHIVSTAAVWKATEQGAAALLALLQPRTTWDPEAEPTSDGDGFIDHLVLLVSGFLWEYEGSLHRLVGLGVVRRLTICSSLSERAHDCYDFGEGNASQRMAYDAFAASIAASNTFKSRETMVATASSKADKPSLASDGGDEWGWGEEESDEANGDVEEATAVVLTGQVQVVALPIVFAPLLHAKGQHASGEPSLFVLSHPLCAAAFPLLLTRVLRHQQRQQQHQQLSTSSSGLPAQSMPQYSHVKEVQSEHIPSEFRRTLKLVAHALGEILSQSRLSAKERIYALGATSLKIGHTLQKILTELEGELTTHTLQSYQSATVVLIDRTSDLATPCSFGVSLLDRLLALLPQSPHSETQYHHSQTNRTGLHVTEIFPLHGCEPSPLSVSIAVDPEHIDSYLPSPFVAGIKWKGGATLCHPRSATVLRSLAFRPAKLALRDLDKRLQDVEKELVNQRKISRVGTTRKPGEKPPSTRGRDVVMRRIGNILEAGEPTSLDHSALIELGVLVLETLERMERGQQAWDSCRERVTRHVQLRAKSAVEWIVPELMDTVQRQFMAAKAGTGPSPVAFRELLTLLVHAYALSSGGPAIEEYTVQQIRNVVTECVVETASQDPATLASLCPELAADLADIVAATGGGGQRGVGQDEEEEEEDWDWDECHSPRKAAVAGAIVNAIDHQQAKEIVDRHLERLLAPLKECAQLFAKQHDAEYHALAAASDATATPRSLVAQVCSALTDSTGSSRQSIAELEHIVDASEQLTRAGIDLLKSGFSRFGFGGAGSGGGGGGGSSSGSIMGDAKVLVVFVVGGITFEEVQEVATAMEGHEAFQVILGGTTITNSGIVLEQLFR